MTEADQIDLALAALANATRRAIVARLAHGRATVNELAEPFNQSLPAISKHIRILEHAGLIRRERQAQFRPCVLNIEPLRLVAKWAEHYNIIWAARFDAMDHILQSTKEANDEQF